MKKVIFRVNQGTSNKSQENCFVEKVKDFENLKEAKKLFNSIKHSKEWTDFYCCTTIEKILIDEEGDEEILDLVEEFFEKQK